jgi:hypothetical protein
MFAMTQHLSMQKARPQSSTKRQSASRVYRALNISYFRGEQCGCFVHAAAWSRAAI